MFLLVGENEQLPLEHVVQSQERANEEEGRSRALRLDMHGREQPHLIPLAVLGRAHKKEGEERAGTLASSLRPHNGSAFRPHRNLDDRSRSTAVHKSSDPPNSALLLSCSSSDSGPRKKGARLLQDSAGPRVLELAWRTRRRDEQGEEEGGREVEKGRKGLQATKEEDAFG